MTRRGLLNGRHGNAFNGGEQEGGLSAHERTGVYSAVDIRADAYGDDDDRGGSPLDVNLDGDDGTLNGYAGQDSAEFSAADGVVNFVLNEISGHAAERLGSPQEDTSPMEVEYESVPGVDPMDVIEDMRVDDGGEDDDESTDQAGTLYLPSFNADDAERSDPVASTEDDEGPTDTTIRVTATAQMNVELDELSQKRRELEELDEKIRAKKEAIAAADEKPGLGGLFSRGLRRFSGAKAADEQELAQLLAQKAAKQAELEATFPAQKKPAEIIERAPETGVLEWIARNKNRVLAAIGGLAAALIVANHSTNQPQNADSSEGSAPSALSVPMPTAPAATEVVKEVETPSTASAEVAAETQPTLWAQILKQANGNEAKAARIKMDFLKNNGAKIVDSVEPDWLDSVENDTALWKGTIQPKLVKWGFAHPSLKMKTSIESAQNLRQLLNLEPANANWLGAEVVLMLKPDFSSADAITTFNTQTAKTESADSTLPNTLPEMAIENAGDDIDLTPFIEPAETAQPSPWYFNADDKDDIALPSPEPVDPTDVPEPVAFLRKSRQGERA